MLSRLTGITIAVIGFLGIAGYAALSIYLSVFGLDSSIATFSQYGFIHFGVLVLVDNAAPVGYIVAAYMILAYLSFRQRATDVPYETIFVNRSKPRISFGSYVVNLFTDEPTRRFFLFLFELAQLAILVGLLVLGAIAGEHYGEKMANSTIHGVALVENPNIRIPERVHLTFSKVANPSPILKIANRLGKLSVVWESNRVISVTAIRDKPIGKTLAVRTWTIPLDSVAQVDRVRTYDRGPVKAAPKTSVAWFWMAFAIVSLLVIVFALLGDYLRRRDVWVRVEPLDESSPLDAEFPDVIADRVSYALALGKDLRVVSFAGDERSLSVVRNNAFPVGHQIKATYPHKKFLKALVSEFHERTRRFGRTDGSSQEGRKMEKSSADR